MRAQDAIDNVATIPQQAIDRAITEQDAFYDFLQLEIHKLFEDLSAKINALVSPAPAD